MPRRNANVMPRLSVFSDQANTVQPDRGSQTSKVDRGHVASLPLHGREAKRLRSTANV